MLPGMQSKSILELRAGPLRMVFDPANAFIRHVRWGGQELVRAIYGAVRDQNWDTIPSAIADLKTDVREDSFHLSFDVLCRARDVDYFWRGTITGEAAGKITYVFEGEARSSFSRNRIGLCVLHPIEECASRRCMIEHVNGAREMGTFPKSISPEQPFFDIRAVNYGKVEVRCEGETFEMEDQRNWGDASFKTYSTPQRLPKPVPVSTGQKVRHAVSVTLHEQPRIWIADTPRLPFPAVGTRVDLDLAAPDFAKHLEQAAQRGRGLVVGFTFDNDTQLAALADAVGRIQPDVRLWMVFRKNETVTSAQSLLAARRVLGSAVEFAGGTREWFVDLNTQRPSKDYPGYLVYAATPHIHQPDDTTMIENIAGLAYGPETAKEFTNKPVVVSPITLKSSPFATAWTIALVSRLAQTGNVHALTLAEPLKLDLEGFQPTHVLPAQSSHPLLVEALAMIDAQGRRHTLVVNFSEQPITVKVNETERTLPPLAVERLDGTLR